MMMSDDLPDGWNWTLLPEICKIQTGKKDVDEGNPLGIYPFFTCAALPTKSDYYSFEGESILLPGNGANVGLSIYFQGKFEAYQRTYVLNQFSEHAKYVYYYFQSAWRDHVLGKQYGSAINYVRMGNFTGFQIPIAPLSEQKRIADKLDTLLARVDSCQTHLSRVPQLLKRFRQSVLAVATSGRLTEEWREEHQISQAWNQTTFGKSGSVTGGLTKNGKRTLLEFTKPYLRVANVYANRLELDDVSEIGLTDSEFEKTKLLKDDLLIVEGNGSLEQVGRAAIWNGEIEDCVHQNHIIRWRSNGSALPKYALFWLLSPKGRSFLVSVASSTSGLNTLSISKVAAVPVSLPSLPEQHEIVRRVEALFALADRLEARWRVAQGRVGSLTPSLLAKAFRGELVPQDAGDESAEKLLERIRAKSP